PPRARRAGAPCVVFPLASSSRRAIARRRAAWCRTRVLAPCFGSPRSRGTKKPRALPIAVGEGPRCQLVRSYASTSPPTQIRRTHDIAPSPRRNYAKESKSEAKVERADPVHGYRALGFPSRTWPQCIQRSVRPCQGGCREGRPKNDGGAPPSLRRAPRGPLDSRPYSAVT